MGWEEVMNYRIPRATRLDANYKMKNDPFVDVCLCADAYVGGEVDMDQLVSHTGGIIL